MTPESSHEQLSTKLAVDEALRNKDVDSKLDEHTKKIDHLTEVTDGLDLKIDKIEKKIDTAAAIAEAIASKNISSRTFYLGCIGVIAATAGAVGAVLAGTGHL